MKNKDASKDLKGLKEGPFVCIIKLYETISLMQFDFIFP